MIGNAAVDTLTVAGNAITANSYFNNNSVVFGSSEVTVVSGSFTMPANPSPSVAIYRTIFRGASDSNGGNALRLSFSQRE